MIIDAALSPAEIDLLPREDLSGTACVVFDVLRATSSIVTALAHGAQEIRPVCTIEEARAMQTQWPGAFLGGERFGNRIDGFDLGNSPLEYCRADLARIVTTTTNGTVALRACAHAKLTLVGALLNMAALAEYLRRSPADRLLLVCAGTFRELALEDVFAAGMLAAEFPDAVLSDAAQTALAVYLQSGGDVSTLLNRAKNGRRLTADGRADDVAFCGQLSRFSAVGIMRDGAIRST